MVKFNVKKLLKDPSNLGWVVWVLLTAVLMGPCLYLMIHYTYDTASPVTRLMVAFFIAAILAGLIDWAGNDVLFRLRRRREAGKRRPARKAKTKKA